MKLFPWRARPQTETTPIGSLTSWSVATASGSIRNFPSLSRYTRLIGLGGPVTEDEEINEDGEGEDWGEDALAVSLPLLKILNILLLDVAVLVLVLSAVMNAAAILRSVQPFVLHSLISSALFLRFPCSVGFKIEEGKRRREAFAAFCLLDSVMLFYKVSRKLELFWVFFFKSSFLLSDVFWDRISSSFPLSCSFQARRTRVLLLFIYFFSIN